MREVPDTTRRFRMRPHYLPEELDRICERVLLEFFRPTHGKIPLPIPTDDLTRLIERDTSDFDPGADLSCYGHAVEGVTEFSTRGKPRVRIEADLAYDEAREHRYRTTLAHEYGHVHLHSYLFQLAVLEAPSTKQGQVCKRDSILNASQIDWLEWQAGYVCGALLMPASAVRKLARQCAEAHNLADATDFRGAPHLAMVEETKRKFQVSEQAARIRLLKLGVLPS